MSEQAEAPIELKYGDKKERPRICKGKTVRVKTGCGNLRVTINRDDSGDIIEFFTELGKNGTCPNTSVKMATLGFSTAIRYGMPVKEAVKYLRGQSCTAAQKIEGQDVASCYDVIGNVLEEELKKHIKPEVD